MDLANQAASWKHHWEVQLLRDPMKDVLDIKSREQRQYFHHTSCSMMVDEWQLPAR
jgi:hypothetical protein